MAVDALKVTNELSTSFITAGTPFMILTTIMNAHDEKIEILEYYYHIPYIAQWLDAKKFGEEWDRYKKLNFFKKIFQSYWKIAAFGPGEDMEIKNRIEANKAIEEVPSGEKTTRSFTAIVPKWLFITGSEVAFRGKIKYLYKKEEHISIFEENFTVRPPLKSNIIGAIIGGILGTTANILRSITSSNPSPDLISLNSLNFLSTSALAVILGVVMVVFSSRRTGDVQPILTIEDFWGGLLAGFLVGYLGHEFFHEIVPIGA